MSNINLFNKLNSSIKEIRGYPDVFVDQKINKIDEMKKVYDRVDRVRSKKQSKLDELKNEVERRSKEILEAQSKAINFRQFDYLSRDRILLQKLKDNTDRQMKSAFEYIYSLVLKLLKYLLEVFLANYTKTIQELSKLITKIQLLTRAVLYSYQKKPVVLSKFPPWNPCRNLIS